MPHSPRCPQIVALVLAVIAAHSTIAWAQVCIAPPQGLVSWWTGNGNPFDQSGDNHAIPHGNIRYASAIVDSGFSFDGASAFLTAPDDTSLDFGAGEDFSIALWMRVEPGSPATQVILDKRVLSGGCALGYYLYLTGGALGFQMDDASGCSNFASSGPDLRDGLFHFVAVTVDRDASTGGHISVDGATVLTFDPSLRPGDLSNAAALSIGRYGLSGPTYFFKGVMDELDVYRRALSASDLAALQGAGGGKCLPVFFYGEDVNTSDPPPTPPDDPVRPDSLPNSRGAQSRFLARLPVAHTESFESLPVGPLTQFMLNGETVTIEGVADVMLQTTDTYRGTYPTEGERFLLSSNNGSSFRLVFSWPQAALGFMGTDIGDGGAHLLLEFHRTDGTTQHVTVPNSTSASGSMPNISGSALFFGYVDPEHPFSAVTFLNPYATLDGFGFDEFVVTGLAEFLSVPGSSRTFTSMRVAPNPTRREVTVSFVLPGESPARVELVDVAGRVVASRRIREGGRGNHEVTFTEPATRAAGMYFVRVVQGGHVETMRVAVVH